MDVGILLTLGGAACAAGGSLISSKQMDRKIDRAIDKKLKSKSPDEVTVTFKKKKENKED